MKRQKMKKPELLETFTELRDFILQYYNGKVVDGKATYPASFYEGISEDLAIRSRKHQETRPAFLNSLYVGAYYLICNKAEGNNGSKVIDFTKTEEYKMLGAYYKLVLSFEEDERSPYNCVELWDKWTEESMKFRAQYPLKATNDFVVAFTRALAEETV